MPGAFRTLRFFWGPGQQIPWISLGIVLLCCLPSFLRSGIDTAVVTLYVLYPGMLFLVHYLLFRSQVSMALSLGGRRRDLFVGSLLSAAGCAPMYLLLLALAVLNLPAEAWEGSYLFTSMCRGVSPVWLLPLLSCLTENLLGRALSLLAVRLGGWSWLCFLLALLLLTALAAISMAVEVSGVLLSGAGLLLLLMIALGALWILLQRFSVR